MNRHFKRSLLAVGTGLALTTLPGYAANNDGTVRGTISTQAAEVVAGAEITITNKDTGLTRVVTAKADGSFRFPRLAIGNYAITAKKPGYETIQLDDIKVSIGSETNVTLTLVSGDIERISISGANVASFDTTTSESALNISAIELERIPVGRSIASVAGLAPGVHSGGFGGISFGGASVGENTVYINGLNVTDVERGIGYSSVPFSFYKEFQVKTGGYSVEFGRTTGGVVNAVTKSGTNNFEFGADLYWTPDSLRSEGRDLYYRNGDIRSNVSRDKSDSYTANIYASGPIIEDKLFFFAMYEPRNVESDNVSGNTSQYLDTSEDDAAFWGAKIDWNISNNHTLEFLAFNDESNTLTDEYVNGEYNSTSFVDWGGLNYSATYTGQWTDDLTVKVLYGHNKIDFNYGDSNDLICNRVLDNRGDVSQHLGCTTSTQYDRRGNERDAVRVDFEYILGDHLLRFGMDDESRTVHFNRARTGPDSTSYTLSTASDGTELVEAYEQRGGVVIDSETSSFYAEDVWTLNDTMTLTLGVRWDEFDLKQNDGSSFLKIDDMVSPRVGFSWDVNGDGESKFFANAGRYYFPISNAVAARDPGVGGVSTLSVYELAGLTEDTVGDGLTNVTPQLGAQISSESFASGSPHGTHDVDQDLDASFQDEYVLGYQMMLNDDWSVGARGIYRHFKNAIEDMIVDYNPFGCDNIGGNWKYGNPGKEITVDLDCNGEIVTKTWDLGEGQRTTGIPGDVVVGSAEPERKYYALELAADKQWDDKWSANISYTWSNSFGNYEGAVNTDTGNDIPGWTEAGDDPSYLNSNWGKMPNHRTHSLIVRGTYAVTEELTAGAVFTLKSGKPIDARSMGTPQSGNQRRHWLHYVCVENCSYETEADLLDSEWQHIPSGFYGDLPTFYQLDLNLAYNTSFKGHDVRFALDVFNVLDTHVTTGVDTRMMSRSWEVDAFNDELRNNEFMMPTSAQGPRFMRVSASFKF